MFGSKDGGFVVDRSGDLNPPPNRRHLDHCPTDCEVLAKTYRRQAPVRISDDERWKRDPQRVLNAGKITEARREA